ncbi:mesoderm posterior protein 1-like [Neopsephotus bourkii]|uniref:mesoderm posterior protein 1-like n=1 Tax=Neopsephotus bourkii TaxID=309878 RepID=UPI002AA5D88F|nr:mesoderm posterior protein 1-like [Neopsephotus bourkii]
MAGPPAPLLPCGFQLPGHGVPLRGPDDATPPTPAAPHVPSRCAPRGRRPGPGAEPWRCGERGPRQSASEREKLRMRRLAQALLRLRHYLPPALAPAGQSLTKIETLRLAARYIAHLSALLGLSEEALARRRGAAPRHCPLCPQGLGCCRSPDPRPLPPAPAPRAASPPGAAGWGSPPVAGPPPELLGAGGVGPGAWGSSPPCGAAAGPPPEVLGVPDMGPGAWGSPPYIPSMRTPPELHGSPGSTSGSWSSPLCSLGAVTPLQPPQRCTAATGTAPASSCCWEPAAPPQPPTAGLTDTGPPAAPAPGSQLAAHLQLRIPPALDSILAAVPHTASVLPGCPPARHWGGWS